MSRHICLKCGCGQEDFAASDRFTRLFWDDVLGVFRRAGVENPYRNLPDDAEVDGGELGRWLEGALERLEAAGDALPQLYAVWSVLREEPDVLWGSDVGYCVWRGETYMVEAVHDQLAAVALAPEEWEQRREQVPYEPPVVEEAAPGLVLGALLSADDFTRIFGGTRLVLEHGPYLRFLAPEIEELRQVARHAGGAGERVVLYTY